MKFLSSKEMDMQIPSQSSHLLQSVLKTNEAPQPQIASLMKKLANEAPPADTNNDDPDYDDAA